jgi:periplasmic protein TonB
MKAQVRWEDIVFENRNQEYGAYVVRKVYPRNIILALLITIAGLALFVCYPLIKAYFFTEEVVEAPVRTIKYTDLAAPPPINKETPPPPKLDIPPPVKEVIKFLPPKVTEKEVEEEIPTIQELKEIEPAAETNQGDGEIVFEEPVEAVVEEAEDPNKIYTIVEQQPEFEGGIPAMMKFISKNMKYPAQSRRMGIEGSVFVSFVVDTDGKIGDVQTVKGISADCDKEAMRVVQAMPRWKAGKQNGKPVKVRFVLPIKFVLG